MTVFVSHSSSCFNNPKLGNNISMDTKMVSFDLFFLYTFRKGTFVDFQQGEQGFHFEKGFPVQNLKAMNHLKALTMISMETKVCQETHYWTSFQKNLT